MNWEALGAIGELVGGLVVLISIFYLAVQIRQNTNQTKLNSIQAINSSNDSAFDPIYIPENSLIFSKGLESYSELLSHEQVVFSMLMARLIASFDATTYQYSHNAYDEEMYWGSAKFYSGFLYSPGGKEWLTSNRDNFSAEALKNLEKAYNQTKLGESA